MFINLPKKLEQRLMALAHDTEKTAASYIEEALEEFLDSHEEYLSSTFSKNEDKKAQLKETRKAELSKSLKSSNGNKHDKP